jgi:spore germination protein GerM
MAKLSNAHAQDHGGTVPDSQSVSAFCSAVRVTEPHSHREQVKALHEFFKGPKGYDKEVAKFREKVEVDQQELRALLQQRLRQA